MHIAVTEQDYRVTLPSGELLVVPRTDGAAASLTDRLASDRRANAARLRLVVEPEPRLPHQALVELLGALRRPREGRPAFPPVRLRGGPGAP